MSTAETAGGAGSTAAGAPTGGGARPRPLSVLAGAALLGALAAALLPRIPLAPWPRLEGPRLTVEAQAPASSRDELLASFTGPLERQLLALAGVEGIDSSTVDGAARLRVRGSFAGRDGGAAAEQLRLAVERRVAATGLPAGAVRVQLLPPDGRALLELAVLGADAAARTAFARGVVVPRLLRAGVAERIEVVGATPLRVVVRPLPAALAARGLTAADLERRLRRLGTTLSVGRVRDGAVARPLVLGEEVSSLDALRALRLPAAAGEAVLGDVATVSLQPHGNGDAFALDGARGVLVRVLAARDGNAVVAGRGLRRAVSSLAAGVPAGLALRVVADGSRGVSGDLLRLLAAALAAGGAAAAMLAWGRRGPRVTLAVAVAPPLALLGAALPLAWIHWPLDPVALAALAAVAGVLTWPALSWLSSGSLEGGSGRAALGGWWVMAAACAPLGYAGGAARALGGGALIAVAAAMGAAYLVALTLTPSLAGAPREMPVRRLPVGASPRVPRAVALPSLVAILALGTIGFARLASRPVPPPSGRAALVRFELPPQLAPEERVRRVERLAGGMLSALPLPSRGWSWRLEEPVDTEPTSRFGGEIRLPFGTPEAAREAAGAARRTLADFPGVRASVSVAEGGWLAGAHEAADPPRVGVPARREWRVAPRPLGPRAADVKADVEGALGGFDAGAVSMPGVEPGIRVLAPPGEAGPGLTPVRAGAEGSRVVALRTVALVGEAPGAVPVTRRDGSPVPRLDPDGSTDELSRAAAELRRTLPLAALLVGAVLVVVAGRPSSAGFAFLVLLLGWAGGCGAALLLAPAPADGLAVMLGLLLLGGIAPQPALLLCRRAEALRRGGWRAGEALGGVAAECRGELLVALSALMASAAVTAVAGGAEVGIARTLATTVAGGAVAAVGGARLLPAAVASRRSAEGE